MDPEDVRQLLSNYHAHVRTELERFGATVEKFIGDAVMALFGAPTAHEDDPERAVRAGLAIRDWARDQDDLKVRIGVTTGEALVALGARPTEGEGMASGDVVNTAARLQAAADVNAILVDEKTYRATARVIGYREHEAVEARGKRQPVPVYEALDARSRPGVDVRQHGGAPLVGRGRELELLTAALDGVRQEREPQLVTLIGVPGIGKSRLVYELFQAVDREPEFTIWRQGRSLAYGDGVTFWALGEMVKAQAGILESDPMDEAQVKLERAAESAVKDGADAAWVSRHLRPLVGLAAAADLAQEQSEVFAAWRRFLEGLAEQHPLVLVFEDLHWADDDLLDFVDELVDWVRGVPMLVVGTARPELLARRPGWGGGKANAITISLRPLTESETGTLVEALLDRALLRADVQAEVLARAGGNPLYAEEFARMVAERGFGAVPGETALPESVQGIIAARLDALPLPEKALLQDAAVVGKVFWLGALAQIGGGEHSTLEELLHALERKEFMRRERHSSVAAETEYAFRHVLVRDVSYGQIPRAARAQKHRAAAEWLESLAVDRSEDKAEMLAHHYASALDFARAAGQDTGELAERAQHALQDAGDRAMALNAPRAAVTFYERALQLLPREADSRPELLFRRGEALDLAGDAARFEALEEAREALLARGDRERAAEAEVLLAHAWWYRGIRDRAFEHQQRAEDLVRDRPRSVATARVLAESARLRMLAGGDEEGIRVAREALAIAEAYGLTSTWAHLMTTIGSAKVRLGNEAGTDEIEQGLAAAIRIGDTFAAARAGQNLAEMHYDAGDISRGRALAEDALRAAERLGGDHLRFQQAIMAWFAFDEGQWAEALEIADRFISESQRAPHTLEPEMHWLRATIRLARDMVDEAVDDLRRAVEAGRRAKDPQSLLPALSMAIRGLAEAGRLEEARDLAAEFVASPDAAEGSSYTYVNFAWVAGQLGFADEMRSLLQRHRRSTKWIAATRAMVDERFEDAAEVFAEMGTRPFEADARLKAAEQLLARGQLVEADRHLEQALAFYRSVGATRYLREGEALLAKR
jgi:hypothetical protein